MLRIVLVLAIVTFTASVAVAHSGGTNSSRCHKNHKTGSYHCH